jgi:hypothetical protein
MPKVVISDHAREQMEERGITEEMVFSIIENPQQTIAQGEDKLIYQSVWYFEHEAKEFLVRVFVNIVKIPNLVITVYLTSKVEKYWRNEN